MDWSGLDVIFSSENIAPHTSGETSQPAPPTSGETNQPAPPTASETDQTSSSSEGGEELIRQLNRYRCKINRQKRKIHVLERNAAKVPSTTLDDVLKYTKVALPPAIYNFVKLQFKCAKVKPKGRRYSDEDLMQSLAIYYQGPRAYRHLRISLYLPHPRVLRKRMEGIQMMPGFQEAVMSILEEKVRKATLADRCVVVSLDEIKLRPKLTYLRGEDYVVGFEDFGEMGRTTRVSNHALVLMVRGVTRKWKQPIGFFYSAGPAPADVMDDILKQGIRRLRKVGLNVIATVCDMGKPNQSLMRQLGVTVDKPSFLVDGEEVVAMYDVPHLFKCIRNALHKDDVNVDGKTASWRHIRQFYQLDSKKTVRTAPKLRPIHIQLGPFEKMKVKYAVQIMSRSVAGGIDLYCENGE